MKPTDTVTAIIRQLNLKLHPEGGYYSETYRSSGFILPKGSHPVLGGKRNFSTAIYFLLTADTFSAFHRIRQDEIWHFYKGSPLTLHVIAPGGKYSTHRLGNDLGKGQSPQVVITGGHWFAAAVAGSEKDFSLVGCTVAPGFDFADFELAQRELLLRKFPLHEKVIREFTRE